MSTARKRDARSVARNCSRLLAGSNFRARSRWFARFTFPRRNKGVFVVYLGLTIFASFGGMLTNEELRAEGVEKGWIFLQR